MPFDSRRTMRSLLLLPVAALLLASRDAVGTPARDAPVLQASGAFFALSVADIETSARWYEERLGLAVVMRAPRTDETRAAVTVLRGGGLTVELVRHDDARPTDANALHRHGI